MKRNEKIFRIGVSIGGGSFGTAGFCRIYSAFGFNRGVYRNSHGDFYGSWSDLGAQESHQTHQPIIGKRGGPKGFPLLVWEIDGKDESVSI